jgi:hypothetical protein
MSEFIMLPVDGSRVAPLSPLMTSTLLVSRFIRFLRFEVFRVNARPGLLYPHGRIAAGNSTEAPMV